MTLEQALLKIIELQQEVMNLKDQLPKITTNIPYISIPYIQADLCFDGGLHNYPSPWMATIPPHCTRCGKQATNYTLASSSYSTTDNTAPLTKVSYKGHSK